MTLIEAEHRFTLPVAPQEAFAVLSDPAKDPDWQTACVGTRLLDGDAHEGGRYEITFAMVGRRMTFTVEIVAYEPGVRSHFKVLDGPFSYTGGYEYSPLEDGGTAVHWTFRVDPGNYFGILPLSLVKKLLITQVKKDSSKLGERLLAA